MVNTGKTLLAEEATVQERQVTVRVLTIGTKQVTQALFRQIKEEEIIDSRTGNLKGEIWGWVNLHDRCWEDGHLHAVWDDNGQLKRSNTPLSFCDQKRERKLVWLARAYLCLLEEDARKDFLRKRIAGWYPGMWTDAHGGTEFSMTVNNRKVSFWIQNGTTFREGATEHLKEANEKLEDHASHEQVYARMNEVADEINQLEANWSQSYQAIKDAGQLFIAVSGVWK